MNNIATYLSHRDKMIDLLGSGDLSKKEFIEASYGYILDKNIKPFAMNKDNTIDAAICNYQYYNILAKKSLIDSQDEIHFDRKESLKCYDKAQEHYANKERVIMEMLELINYKGIEAYFLIMDAKHLESHIYEVIVDGRPRAVFHLVDKRILNRLRKNGVFFETPRNSVISGYINEEY